MKKLKYLFLGTLFVFIASLSLTSQAIAHEPLGKQLLYSHQSKQIALKKHIQCIKTQTTISGNTYQRHGSNKTVFKRRYMKSFISDGSSGCYLNPRPT